MNVGDILMYEINYTAEAIDDFTSHIKYTILNKQNFADSVTYSLQEIIASHGGAVAPISIIDTVVWTFKDSVMHVANAYPGQFFPSIYYPIDPISRSFTPIAPSNNSSYTSGMTYATYFSHPTFPLKCKQIGASPPNVRYALYDSIVNGNELIYSSSPWFVGPAYNCTFCEGVGEASVHFDNGPFTFDPFTFSRQLIGYIKNNIQQGDVWTDSVLLIFLNTDQVNRNPAASIFSNPVSNNVFVSLPGTSCNSTSLFTLYDLTGRKVLEQHLS
ncbi:MAG: hypothetical protein JWO06_2879, partial [Bacteroidota bacterium]|nr:hypothetical protein [Bacteroidota bacterium]